MQSQKDVQKTCNRDEDSFKICIMPVRSGRLYCLVYFCTNWHFVCISLNFCRGYTSAVVQNHFILQMEFVILKEDPIFHFCFDKKKSFSSFFYLRCHVFMTVHMKRINSKDIL